jgi:hypothetical protein
LNRPVAFDGGYHSSCPVARCPVGVNRVGLTAYRRLPLHPRQETSSCRLGRFVSCPADTESADAKGPLFLIMWTSTLLIRMHPLIRRNLPLLGQLDHPNRRLVTARAAGPASERRLQLPDRRVTRPADSIQRRARPRLASAAFDLHHQLGIDRSLAMADRHADRCHDAVRRRDKYAIRCTENKRSPLTPAMRLFLAVAR